jgi:hypothetical protein
MMRKITCLKVGSLLFLAALGCALWAQVMYTAQASHTLHETPAEVHTRLFSGIIQLPNMVIMDTASFSASDIWITGNYQPPPPTCYTHCYNMDGPQPFFQHFNGTQWQVINGPTGYYGSLDSLGAIASNNLYAVGFSQGPNVTPLVEHWNGTAWSVVNTPPPNGEVYGQFHAALAFSSTNIWFAGEYMDYQSQQHHPLINHWDGNKWNVVSVSDTTITSITAMKPLDQWSHTVLATGKDVNNNTVLLQLS